MSTAHAHFVTHDRESSRLDRFLHRAWRFSRPAFLTILILGVLLIAARIALPYVLKTQINKRLAAIPDYHGEVAGVHVALWRGAYALENLKIVKKSGAVSEPFFSAENIDFSIAWRELVHRKIVSDITVEKPKLSFIKAKTAEASQLEADRRWQDVIKAIFPIDITYLRLNHADVHYVDKTVDPEVDVFVSEMTLIATGLRNRPAEKGQEFPAEIEMQGNTNGKGKMVTIAHVDPLADKPHFEVRTTVESVSLPELNKFLRAYGNVDVSKGDFKLFAEMAAKDGRFEGYVKPFFTDVSFKDLKDQQKKSVLQHFWEIIVTGAVDILKNKEKNQVAARIPFAGEFGSTQIGFWATVRSIFHHGFIAALPASLEHSVKSDDIPEAPQPVKVPTKIPDQKKSN